MTLEGTGPCTNRHFHPFSPVRAEASVARGTSVAGERSAWHVDMYEQLPFLVMGRSQRKPSSLFVVVLTNPFLTMFSLLGADSGSAMNSSLTAYGTEYTSTRDTYLAAAKALKEATGPYKATRDAYVAATATYTKSLYE
jgi:hypothetical protein